MKRSYTQKEIYDYLKANPLEVQVHVGDLEDMEGQDYIFLDYMNDISMLRDDTADYQTIIQISVLTKDYEDRKTLVKYIKNQFLSAPTYSRSVEAEYYQAQFTVGVFINE
jgi:hypothetical protein